MKELNLILRPNQRDHIRFTDFGEKLAVTIVEMEPGGFQHLHAHEPEQSYYILEGTGLMTADGEE